MSDQIARTPLQGPITYDFGEATPKEWPQGEYVPKAIYQEAAAGETAWRQRAENEHDKALAAGADRALLRQRVKALEAALLKHHTGIGAVNYCRTCGGHFNWEDPAQPVRFTNDGETKS